MSDRLRSNLGTGAVPRVRDYAAALGAVVVATVLGWPLYHGFHLPDERRPHLVANTNVLMLYLVGVVWVATRYSRRAAIVASVLGVLLFDLCFVPPYLRFNVADQQYLITFSVMLLTALVISTQTDRLRSQSAAAREAWERAEAEFLRNTLLSGVSHDLRTPLAAITGATSLLVESGDRLPMAARAELLAAIADEADRMERLVNNLLDMTRLEAGGLALKREWQHVQEVVGAALHHSLKRLGDRPVTTDVPATLPMVYIDSVAVEQVLVNLLDNAVEYTPAGQAIDVTARATAAEVSVEVADRGPGLPPEAGQRVFEKYFRASPRTGKARGGLGLGLAICKGLVEAHGGTITAANRPGGGAVFRVSLPHTQAPLVDGSA